MTGKLISVTMNCGDCGCDSILHDHQIVLDYESRPCDDCGSHERITITFWCETCQEHKATELYSV